MSLLNRLRRRLGVLLRKHEVERDMDEEMSFHVAMEARDLAERQGLSAAEARRRALVAFGGVERYKEQGRDARGVRLVEDVSQDLRYAARQIGRSPGFAAVAVATLALGIGANASIFSVVNGVLLRPLPYPAPDALVHVTRTHPELTPTYGIYSRSGAMAPPDYLDLRERTRAFVDLAAFSGAGYTLSGHGDPLWLDGGAASASLFTVLGIPPLLGRGFTEAENEPGAEPVVVLGHALWQQRFGGDPGILGRRIELNETSHTVIGVMPAGFHFQGWELLTPITYDATFRSVRGRIWLRVIGRMAPGVTVEQATSDLARVAAELGEEYPATNAERGAAAVPLKKALVGDAEAPLVILLAAVGLVLLIACANVANLMLARSAARGREIALRVALGAKRARLVRQLLTESLLIAAIGGALGLLLAALGTRFLAGLEAVGLPTGDALTVDGAVLAFIAGLVLLTGLLFGMAPALQATRPDPIVALKGGTRVAPGRRGALRQGLVVAQVGLAVMLLIGAGLLIRSFGNLQRIDPGFLADGAIALNIGLPTSRYPEDHHREQFYRELVERVAALPGVQSAGAVLALPMTGTDLISSYQVAGREPQEGAQPTPLQTRVATPSYFRTVGIPLVAGRGFTDADRDGAPPVVLLNRTAARAIFGDESPLGHSIQIGWFGQQVGGEIVGVVGDVRQFGLDHEFVPEIYLPHAQLATSGMTVVARASGDPASILPAIRAIFGTLDPNLPIIRVRTIDEILAASVAAPRFIMLLLAIFAVLAAILAAIGIYGVIAYWVRQRTGEIGIRLALGGTRATVLGFVFRQTALLVGAGVVLGLVGAFAATRVLATLLFGVSATEPAVFILVPLLLAGVALLACAIPAHRATSVHPSVALRAE